MAKTSPYPSPSNDAGCSRPGLDMRRRTARERGRHLVDGALDGGRHGAEVRAVDVGLDVEGPRHVEVGDVHGARGPREAREVREELRLRLGLQRGRAERVHRAVLRLRGLHGDEVLHAALVDPEARRHERAADPNATLATIDAATSVVDDIYFDSQGGGFESGAYVIRRGRQHR